MTKNFTHFQLTTAEMTVVNSARKPNGRIKWDDASLDPIKKRIKVLHLQIQNTSCCYCRKNLHGEFNMVIDIEHVLPQSDFSTLVFDPVNLSIACKRCNMNVKNSDWNFVFSAPLAQVILNRNLSSTYEIIHPNLDTYSDHIDYFEVCKNNTRLIKYAPKKKSHKGLRTYNYFRLKELEINRMDEAQGIAPIIMSTIASLTRALFFKNK